MPILHIGLGCTTYPKIIAHNFTVNIQGIVLSQSPIWPMERVIGGNQSFLNMLIRSIIIFQWFTCRIFHLKKTVTATGNQHCSGSK